MPKTRKPRSGSLQFWPRVKAKKNYAVIGNWLTSSNPKPLAFAGYKVGMTHVQEAKPGKRSTEAMITTPVTVIECPPLKPLSLRFYKKTPYGTKVITEIFSNKLDKELGKKIVLPKKLEEKQVPEHYDVLKLVVYTQPKLTGIGKKKPEIFEIPLGGDLEYAKSLLNKEIRAEDVFKAGQMVDSHGITKGKGFQGPVKRFGVSLKQHKSEKKKRSAGNLGSFTPRKSNWRVAQHGQMGYHQRSEYNKLIMSIGSDPSLINQVGGFKHYGIVKNDYILVKGSLPGSSKRLVILLESIRGTKPKTISEIKYISRESKQ
ncbi:50S ribosomal protein L3 [Candidatus Woesearchaeota archaeon]|nr:50S ribosomal protein L3 [Candidatus Woesearchaeota archaeon]